MGRPSDTWSDSDEPTDTANSTIEMGTPEQVSAPTPESSAGRYGPPRLLGEGGIGSVYATHDSRLGREVARKQLKPGASHGNLRRFLREARVTAQLEHPGIVPVHDAGVDAEGRQFYTMKFVRGRSLGDALHQASSLSERLKWMDSLVDTVEALAYAHSRGVIHRDLKPDNIMVGEFGETLVVDWGLARALDEIEGREPTDERSLDLGDARHTMLGSISGTPAYMSVEQALGGTLGPPADVFGLGAILYEILTGRPPYRAESAMETLELAREGTWVPVLAAEPGAPPELAAIAEKALAFDPADRYPDAGAMVRDLTDWQHGLRVSAHDYSSRELLGRFVAAYRAPLGALGLGLLLTGGTGLAGWWSTVAQRDAAVAARADAERALAASYQARAESAASEGSPVEALFFAASALQVREDPESRGVLARFASSPLLESVWSKDVPCVHHALLPDGLLCAGGDQTTRLTPEGEVVWIARGEGRLVGTWGDRFIQRRRNERLVVERSLDDGRVLGTFDGFHNGHYRPDGTLWLFDRNRIVRRTLDGVLHEGEGPGSLSTGLVERDGSLHGATVSGSVFRYDDSGGMTELRYSRDTTYDLGFVGETPVSAGDRVERWSADGSTELTVLDVGHAVPDIDTFGDRVAMVDTSGRMTVWDAVQDIVEFSLQTDSGLGGVSFLDAHHLVVGGEKRVRVWRLGEGSPEAVDVGRHTSQVVVGPDGERAVACGLGSFSMLQLDPLGVLWRRSEGRPALGAICGWVDSETVVQLPQNEVPAVRSASNGDPLRSVGITEPLDGLVLDGGFLLRFETDPAILDLDGEVVMRMEGLRGGLIPMDGRLYADVAQGVVEVDLATRTLETVIPGVEEHVRGLGEHGYLASRGDVLSYFSRDGTEICEVGRSVGEPVLLGKRLVVPRSDGNLSVLGVPDGPGEPCPLLAELRGHEQRVARTHLRGDRLITFGWDGVVRRWDLGALELDPGEVLEDVSRRTGMSLRDGQVVLGP